MAAHRLASHSRQSPLLAPSSWLCRAAQVMCCFTETAPGTSAFTRLSAGLLPLTPSPHPRTRVAALRLLEGPLEALGLQHQVHPPPRRAQPLQVRIEEKSQRSKWVSWHAVRS